jgi:transcriptional regulator with XRE-family HTH domain
VRLNNPERLQRDVGRRVAEVRAERGLTQEELAEKVGVSVRYLQAVEAGAENLTIESIANLGNSLRIAAAEFFTAPAATVSRRGRPPKTAK